jgi:uncharacterized protein YpmB
MRKWLTDQAIRAIFDKLEKGAVRIGGVDPDGRELVLWVSQPKSKTSSKEGSGSVSGAKRSTRLTKRERVR